MSSPLTIYADASDGYIWSYDSTYADARAGTGSISAITGGKYLPQGQVDNPPYYFFLSYIQFDTSGAENNVSVAELSLKQYSSLYDDQAFTAWAAQYDWGENLTTADFVAGADLSALTKVASIASADIALSTYNAFESEAAFPAAINVEGYTRLILFTNRMESGDAPAGFTERVNWHSADSDGTTSDPKLYVEYDDVAQITPVAMHHYDLLRR